MKAKLVGLEPDLAGGFGLTGAVGAVFAAARFQVIEQYL
jgi:hypothetical protein